MVPSLQAMAAQTPPSYLLNVSSMFPQILDLFDIPTFQELSFLHIYFRLLLRLGNHQI
jgi:hypothetical protein